VILSGPPDDRLAVPGVAGYLGEEGSERGSGGPAMPGASFLGGAWRAAAGRGGRKARGGWSGPLPAYQGQRG
jgi:hypothetical protein